MEVSEKKFKLYAVGSAQISQFCIPLPEGKTQKPSYARKPLCLSTIQQFDIIEDPDAEQIKVNKIPNLILKQNITTVVCGGVHTLLLTKDKKVFSFGSNDQGALGRKGQQMIPNLVDISEPIDMIAAGDCHSMFLNYEQDLLFFCGVYRGIVKGHIAEKVLIPEWISLATLSNNKRYEKINKIVSGFNHSMILVDNTIFIRGDIEYSALGRKILDRHKDQVKPTSWLAIGLKKVQDIWTGGMHCFASVKKGKTIQYYGWGNNSFGQLGLGHKKQVSIPEKVQYLQGMNIKKIVGGQHHTIVLTEEGEAFSFGKNDYGQLGLGQDFNFSQNEQEQSQNQKQVQMSINCSLKPRKINLQNITDIISGPHFSYAITNKRNQNQLFSWGFSASYVLINGSQDNDKAQPYHVLQKILNFQKIIQLSAGGQHLMYLAQPNPNPPQAEDNVIYVSSSPVPPVPPFVSYSSQALNTLSTGLTQVDSNQFSQSILIGGSVQFSGQSQNTTINNTQPSTNIQQGKQPSNF